MDVFKVACKELKLRLFTGTLKFPNVKLFAPAMRINRSLEKK